MSCTTTWKMDPSNSATPFVIDPNVIYPMSWLRERLHGVIELPTLLDRTGLRAKRKFRDAILGSELLEGLARDEPEIELPPERHFCLYAADSFRDFEQ